MHPCGTASMPSLYLKGTSDRLYHGKGACGSERANRARNPEVWTSGRGTPRLLLRDQQLVQPVQLVFGAEVDFNGSSRRLASDADLRAERKSQAVLHGSRVNVL